MFTHLEPDIIESEVKCALRSISANKVSRGDGILAERFKILKDYIVKVLHSICQQIWKTQKLPQDWKRIDFIQIPKRAMPKSVQTTTELQSLHMLVRLFSKILQARLQQYVN